MASEFHNPHGAETDQQIAYQQSILSTQSLGAAPGGPYDTEPPPGGYGHSSGGLLGFGSGSGSDGRKSSGHRPSTSFSMGASLGTALKTLVDDVGTGLKGATGTIRGARDFVTLEARITRDLQDGQLFPEVGRVAEVRRGLALCEEERAFVEKRKVKVRDAFARYMGWDPALVHPDDVPTVALGGSGGGYKAMLALLGYCQAMKQAGLWDAISYIAGVSGSCWAISAYYTFGQASFDRVIEHCKRRLSPHHPLSPDAVRTLLHVPGGDYETIGPLIHKHRRGLTTVAMDLYSVFTTGYLFISEDPIATPGGSAETEIPGHQKTWWKWSNAKRFLSDGQEPMPILTAVRHERPWNAWADAEHPFHDDDPTAPEHQQASDAWFQWFEMTPYEVGSDELAAWVPIWAFGRRFEQGRSVPGANLPEQSLALLLGMCTSAPSGPLSSYLATIQRALPLGFLANSISSLASGVKKMLGKKDTPMLESYHPLHASSEHNFLYHYTMVGQGGQTPPGIENSPRINLVDGGLDNNCPTYVLLHPSREVDVILSMDASSDVLNNSFEQRLQQVGHRRGVNFTPRMGHLRPKEGVPDTDPTRFDGLYGQIYDGVRMEAGKRPATIVDSYGRTVANPPAPLATRDCTLVYLPLLPNARSVPGYDPNTAEFSGSYNLVWTPEQVDMIVRLSGQNFRDAEAAVKHALFNAWQRRRWYREQGELARQQQQQQTAAPAAGEVGSTTVPAATTAPAVTPAHPTPAVTTVPAGTEAPSGAVATAPAPASAAPSTAAATPAVVPAPVPAAAPTTATPTTAVEPVELPATPEPAATQPAPQTTPAPAPTATAAPLPPQQPPTSGPSAAPAPATAPATTTTFPPPPPGPPPKQQQATAPPPPVAAVPAAPPAATTAAPAAMTAPPAVTAAPPAAAATSGPAQPPAPPQGTHMLASFPPPPPGPPPAKKQQEPPVQAPSFPPPPPGPPPTKQQQEPPVQAPAQPPVATQETHYPPPPPGGPPPKQQQQQATVPSFPPPPTEPVD